jgi:hypothetical protein
VDASPEIEVTVVPLVKWSLLTIGEAKDQVQVRGDLVVEGAVFDDAVRATPVDVTVGETPVAARIGKVAGRRAVWASESVPITSEGPVPAELRVEGVGGGRQAFGRQRLAITGEAVSLDGRTLTLTLEPGSDGRDEGVMLRVDA